MSKENLLVTKLALQGLAGFLGGGITLGIGSGLFVESKLQSGVSLFGPANFTKGLIAFDAVFTLADIGLLYLTLKGVNSANQELSRRRLR